MLINLLKAVISCPYLLLILSFYSLCYLFRTFTVYSFVIWSFFDWLGFWRILSMVYKTCSLFSFLSLIKRPHFLFSNYSGLLNLIWAKISFKMRQLDMETSRTLCFALSCRSIHLFFSSAFSYSWNQVQLILWLLILHYIVLLHYSTVFPPKR